MRAVLLVAAAGLIAGYLSQVSFVTLPGLPPPVTCSLPEEACPDVAWIGHIQWTTDIPTIKAVEFRELPPRWGEELPFEPMWAAQVEMWFDPTGAAACRSNPKGGLVCHAYIEYDDPEDSPWYVPTPRERQLAWCRDPDNKPTMFLVAYELDLGQAPVSVLDPTTVFHQEYGEWDWGGEFTETLDRVCEAAYASR